MTHSEQFPPNSDQDPQTGFEDISAAESERPQPIDATADPQDQTQQFATGNFLGLTTPEITEAQSEETSTQAMGEFTPREITVEALQEQIARLRKIHREQKAEIHELTKKNTALERKLARSKAENEALTKDNRELKIDPVTGFLTRAGLELAIKKGEIKIDDNSAVCFLDLRALKYVNDSTSHKIGDAFLSYAAQQIAVCLRENTRSRGSTETFGPERRYVSAMEGSLTDDKVRYGGDEFVIIFHNVSPADMTPLSARLLAYFSVAQATTEYERARQRGEPHIPIIASIVFGHMRSTNVNLSDADPLRRFNALMEQVKDVHETDKKRQYNEMWASVMSAGVQSGIDAVRPEEDRTVAERFFKVRVPDYLANIRALVNVCVDE